MALKPARILITLDDGPLAFALKRVFRAEEVILLSTGEDDITKWRISATVRDLSPDVVIHLASLDGISECERHPDLAYEMNYVGTQNVALGCRAAQASLVYLSTGSVFQGKQGVSYREFDTPRPMSVWGMSKLAGEEVVRQTLHEFYIVRTSWLFGIRVQSKSSEEIVAECASSVAGNPTYVVDLAEAISHLIRSGRYGTYHLVNEGSCTLRDFLEMTQSLLPDDLSLNEAFPLDLDAIDKSGHGSLLCNFASKQIGIKLRSWEAALSEYVDIRKTLVEW